VQTSTAGSSAPAPDPRPTAVVPPSSDPTVVLRPRAGDVPAADAREQTRPLVQPAQQQQQGAPAAPAPPAPPPAAREGGRPWTWVLLTLLPILVIAAAGLLLFFLFTGG
jgi:hypothetical protein